MFLWLTEAGGCLPTWHVTVDFFAHRIWLVYGMALLPMSASGWGYWHRHGPATEESGFQGPCCEQLQPSTGVCAAGRSDPNSSRLGVGTDWSPDLRCPQYALGRIHSKHPTHCVPTTGSVLWTLLWHLEMLEASHTCCCYSVPCVSVL